MFSEAKLSKDLLILQVIGKNKNVLEKQQHDNNSVFNGLKPT